jgi:aspartate-semialdehyde dehydrogenase
MSKKLQVGIIGATGYVGQRFVSLLQDHPFFEIRKLAASERSAGKAYGEVLQSKQHDFLKLNEKTSKIILERLNIEDVPTFARDLDFCFCAVNMEKDAIVALEEALAKEGLGVVSNNSANRLKPDVPMVIPEINPQHFDMIEQQRKRLGTDTGFIVCKPNCSIQSYVPALHALKKWDPEVVFVSTYQAISGAGKTFETWPEARDNVIPYIGGEEEKSEQEPHKIWGQITEDGIVASEKPAISAHCFRVGVQEGHTASVTVKFKNKPSKEEILEAWANYEGLPQQYNLPQAPEHFIHYLEDPSHPQAKYDATVDKGMAIQISRLREDSILDYKFACLSHNTLRGAAGGAVLTAELLYKLGWIQAR